MKASSSPLWFIRLRWFAFGGLLAVLIAAVSFFHLNIPSKTIAALLFVIPITNILARTKLVERFTETQLIGSLLAIDSALLTAVLYHSGGPTNPFTNVYMLYVVLAAVMLTPRWTWITLTLSALGFAILFLASEPILQMHGHGSHHGFSFHLHGMLLAFLLVASFLAYFLNKIVGELRRKERRLVQLEAVAANQQRLAALTTVTANAAHEFATPLATIAVIAGELERSFKAQNTNPEVMEDIKLIQEQTVRCKQILEGLSEMTGDLIGESPQRATFREIFVAAAEPLEGREIIRSQGDLDTVLESIPRKAVTLAVRALLKNALESADPTSGSVVVTALQSDTHAEITISDNGVGMDLETLERLGEPFFSMKSSGTGLGVYLARLTAQQLEGGLNFVSAPGRGTTATLLFATRTRTIRRAI